MSKLSKVVDAQTQKRETIEGGATQTDAARPKGEARAWVTDNKFPRGSKNFDARRNVPSGPLGGSGRKTNSSRSS